jgi:hypothetical protein
MKKLISLSILVFIAFGPIIAQRVSPYQSGSYFPGLVNIRDLAAAPAGIILLDYNYWNVTKGYYDKNGNEFSGGTIDLPSPINSVDFTDKPEISGYINVPFLFYASKFKVLGGAKYLASISPVYMKLKYSVFLALGDTSGNITGNSHGFGDLAFMPLGLSWSFDKKLDVSFMYSLYAPTGRYETGGEDNLGMGIWTHQLQVPTYFYAMEQATAFAVIPTLELNGKVKDADARPGHRFSLEYGISQYFTSWLEVELMNAHNWQISDDTGDDVWWTGTQFDGRDRKNIFSAGIGIWPVEGILNLRVKYIMDYGLRQRFKNSFWSFSLLIIPGILD